MIQLSVNNERELKAAVRNLESTKKKLSHVYDILEARNSNGRDHVLYAHEAAFNAIYFVEEDVLSKAEVVKGIR